MIVLLLLLIIVLLGVPAAAVWSLATEGPGSGFMRQHFPMPVLNLMWHVASWFDADESQSEPARRAPAGPPPPDLRPVPPPPALPPVRDAGPAPALTGAMISPDHQAVHARIAGFEPEDDTDLLAFICGEAAAQGGYAEAWEAFTDTLLHSVGLDPAFTQVAAELAGEVSDLAHSYAVVIQRFNVIYAQVQDFVANGGVLPYQARTFLTGGAA